MSDYISRADAIEAVDERWGDIKRTNKRVAKGHEAVYLDMRATISALPSADAEPTVIRSRTLMPTKDFKEWAKRIREENPNAIIIPCDAEVVPAEAEDRHYIKIYADDEPSVKAEKLYQICGETQNREVTEWLKEYFPSADAEWIPVSERLPKKGEVVLITNGKGNVRCGQYRSEHDVRGDTHYWWWKGKTVESVLAWIPLPKPYKGGDEE